MEFVREFGLILFVYAIGMQVGPGFVDSLRRRGLRLNLVAGGIVIFGAALAAAFHLLGLFPLPVAVGVYGIDPIHFGVVLVCCCGVGFSTPPLGENIFIASGIADTTLEDISYNALPFVFVTVGVIILCVFVPDIVLFLPRMMY